MKSTLIAISLLISSSVLAENSHTQDNINYVITMGENKNWEKCGEQICRLSSNYGNGTCSILGNLGIVSANLTSAGVALITKLTCVVAIEVEGVVEALPRVGRSN